MSKFADTVEMLNAFSTANDIANFFELVGVKGSTGISNQCPIANYLRKQGFDDPEVGIDRAYVDKENYTPGEYSWESVSFSQSTREFVTRFDHGQYPNLIS